MYCRLAGIHCKGSYEHLCDVRDGIGDCTSLIKLGLKTSNHRVLIKLTRKIFLADITFVLALLFVSIFNVTFIFVLFYNISTNFTNNTSGRTHQNQNKTIIKRF